MSVRLIGLTVLVAGLGWFELAQPLTARELARDAGDLLDRRLARHVLILGNSRTSYHDMPGMIRAMADASGDPRKLEIVLDAPPGASFESLWADARARTLLRRTWDDVVLQPESRATASDALRESFQTYGARLIGAARLVSGRPRLIVNWSYDARLWDDGDPTGRGRSAYDAAIQSATAALGRRTGARLVNVAEMWSAAAGRHPEIALTEDGNHPTLAGSYLLALALYADLSRRDVASVRYVPGGLDEATAASLRRVVRDYQAVTA